MTSAITIATTIRIPHSRTARLESRFDFGGGAIAPGSAPSGRAPSPPPDPLADGGGAAPAGASTTVGASTSSVTEDAPRPHPRRSVAESRTRGRVGCSLVVIPASEARGGVDAEVRELGGCHHGDVRSDCHEQPLEPGRLADRQHDVPGAVSGARRRLVRMALDDPLG